MRGISALGPSTETLRPGLYPDPSLQIGAGPEESRELASLGLDLLQVALDLAGVVDPTPACDGTSALISLARGDWFGAALSGVGAIPWVGDLAKAGKLPRCERVVTRALSLASRSEAAARALLPILARLHGVLSWLPARASPTLDGIRTKVGGFLRARGGPPPLDLPDVSRTFHFPPRYEVGQFTYAEASGRLGVPGRVKRHRSRSAQKGVSRGTGDDAGHRIGDRFGAPGDPQNLARQNWIQNRAGGTFYELEERWAHLLESGTGVEVTVTDVFRRGEARPFMRRAEWVEIAPDGTHSEAHELLFGNFSSVRQREAAGSALEQLIEEAGRAPSRGGLAPVVDLHEYRRSRRVE